jgi:hypothetical protein
LANHFVYSVGAALQTHFYPGTVVVYTVQGRGRTTKAGFQKRATWFSKSPARRIRREWEAKKTQSCLQ